MSDQKRPYRMKRRAELVEETRRRITESAVALHERIGPAQTSISAIAEQAGVRRSTVYRHFPDEDALFAACSSHFRALHPAPDPAAWAAVGDPDARTATALSELYSFYGGAQRMYESLFRDESLVPAVRRRLRDFHGYLEDARHALMTGRSLRGRAAEHTRAALGHALAFATWRSLTQEQALTDDDAVALMCRLVQSASRR
jgi:AcrR family transcriptional regulator